MERGTGPDLFAFRSRGGAFSFDPPTRLLQIGWRRAETRASPERADGGAQSNTDEVAKYQGTGDVNDAGNFICVNEITALNH